MPDILYIFFLFVLGACIGSFLNVVVYRLPAEISLATPPSHCPKCKHPLAWYDNIPIFGWLFLAGRCRYCHARISIRYPLVELFCGLLFALMCGVVMQQGGPFYSVHDAEGHLRVFQSMRLDTGNWPPALGDWPLFGLYLFAASTLLAVSLIDFDLYLIPSSLPILLAGVALAAHTLVDHPTTPGALNCTPSQMALTAGLSGGLLLSIILLKRGIIPLSFAAGESPLEIEKIAQEQKRKSEPEAQDELLEYTPAQIRAEIRKEMLFIFFPLLFGVVSVFAMRLPAISHFWLRASHHDPLTGAMGSLLGALVGGGTIWLIRIFGSYLFGKEAMGLGDIDLMFGVGAVVGALYATIAFFISPFIALPLALVLWIFTGRRQIPYGPYLSVATLVIMLFPFQFHEFIMPESIMPGLQGLSMLLPSVLQ